MTKTGASKINHKVLNVAKSETSKSPKPTNEEESSKIEATRNTVQARAIAEEDPSAPEAWRARNRRIETGDYSLGKGS